jgi:antirestriction protein
MTTSVSTTAQPTIKAFNAKAQIASVSDYIADDLNAACIYVGTYRKYNEGSIFGEWIDLDKISDYEELLEVCHKLHSDEDDPEFMVQDYQNFPRDFYSECLDEDDFDKIKAYLELGDKKEAYEAYVDATGDDDIERFLARYEGEWDSEEEFAEHFVEECYPEIADSTLGQYFDYQRFARDLFYDYTYWDGHVFHNY